LKYYDNAQLINEREAYRVQLASFATEVEHLWDVLQADYDDSKRFKRIVDFDDLASAYKRKIVSRYKSKTGDPIYEDTAKVWDEISFVKPQETEIEKMNQTFLYEKDKIRSKLIIMRNKLKNRYDYQYPIERRVMEERLSFLETEFNKFDYMINPFHIQPGLLMDMDITSIKRKKATLDGMANVLNEFLHSVSKGFQDAAFASFSRRRSTVRVDLSQSFAPPETDDGHSAAKDLLAEINQDALPVAQAESKPKRGPKPGTRRATSKKGVVDSGKSRRGRGK